MFPSKKASIEKKKPYVTLSTEQKQEICQRKAENPQLSNLELAIEYCTGKTTIQNIIARSEKWINIDINEPYAKKLRNRRPKWQTLEEALIFLEQQENIEFKTEDLTVIRHLINQIELHRLSLLKQPSITSFLC